MFQQTARQPLDEEISSVDKQDPGPALGRHVDQPLKHRYLVAPLTPMAVARLILVF